MTPEIQRLKDFNDAISIPVTYILNKHQAVLTKPRTFLQLQNAGEEPCQVLYIVSPAYLFELNEAGAVSTLGF